MILIEEFNLPFSILPLHIQQCRVFWLVYIWWNFSGESRQSIHPLWVSSMHVHIENSILEELNSSPENPWCSYKSILRRLRRQEENSRQKIVNSTKLEFFFFSYHLYWNLSAMAMASTSKRWRLLHSLGIVIVELFFCRKVEPKFMWI